MLIARCLDIFHTNIILRFGSLQHSLALHLGYLSSFTPAFLSSHTLDYDFFPHF